MYDIRRLTVWWSHLSRDKMKNIEIWYGSWFFSRRKSSFLLIIPSWIFDTFWFCLKRLVITEPDEATIWCPSLVTWIHIDMYCICIYVYMWLIDQGMYTSCHNCTLFLISMSRCVLFNISMSSSALVKWHEIAHPDIEL